jgi:putative zinc finger/helix-turn-helix YgiT family protein
MTREKIAEQPRKRRDRPFPWRCAKCLKEEVYPETIPYAPEIKHDGRLYRIEIPQLRVPKCRACGELIFSNSVDDQIMQALRVHLRLLTPEQIRSRRVALGLKKKQLAERLGVAAATISRWESGLLIQTRAMDNYLRVYFAVPEARAVLQGAGQDTNLGIKGNADPARVESDPPAPAVNRIWRTLRDVEKERKRQQAFDPAVN